MLGSNKVFVLYGEKHKSMSGRLVSPHTVNDNVLHSTVNAAFDELGYNEIPLLLKSSLLFLTEFEKIQSLKQKIAQSLGFR